MTNFDDVEPKFPFEISTKTTYKWSIYGFEAIVQPVENYRGTDPAKQIRVKIKRITKRPKRGGMNFAVNENVPLCVDELIPLK